MIRHKAFIFVNGLLRVPQVIKSLIQPGDLIIAADGGGMHLAALGIIPHYVIGDMDSISPELLSYFEASGSQALKYPSEKNETDLELAINLALEKGATQLCIAAALGGRLDQTLGNIGLLNMERFSDIEVSLEDGVEKVGLIRDHLIIKGEVGDTISLIPWGDAVPGVTTTGLKYPLFHETLYPEKTRGISNVLSLSEAMISIDSGRLLCIHTQHPKEVSHV